MQDSTITSSSVADVKSEYTRHFTKVRVQDECGVVHSPHHLKSLIKYVPERMDGFSS